MGLVRLLNDFPIRNEITESGNTVYWRDKTFSQILKRTNKNLELFEVEV